MKARRVSGPAPNLRPRMRQRRDKFFPAEKRHFAAHFRRSQAQTPEEDGEAKSGWLAELPIQKRDENGAKQKNWQCFAVAESAQAKPAKPERERNTPEQIGQAEDGS